jgi:hypothetical protein
MRQISGCLTFITFFKLLCFATSTVSKFYEKGRLGFDLVRTLWFSDINVVFSSSTISWPFTTQVRVCENGTFKIKNPAKLDPSSLKNLKTGDQIGKFFKSNCQHNSFFRGCFLQCTTLYSRLRMVWTDLLPRGCYPGKHTVNNKCKASFKDGTAPYSKHCQAVPLTDHITLSAYFV